MSIHGSYDADGIAAGMHSSIGGIGQAAVAAWILDRQQDDARRIQNAAACIDARSGILRNTVRDLREQIAQERHAHLEEVLDLQADLEVFRSDSVALRERVAQLGAAVVQLDGQRRALATALSKARAA